MSALRPARLLVVPLAALAAVLLLAWLVRTGETRTFDTRALLAIAYPSPPLLLRVAAGVTALGDSAVRGGIVAVGVLGLLAVRVYRRAAVLAGCVAGGALLNWAAKLAMLRERPRLLPHLDAVSNSSFPSGHAANATVLYVSLALLAPPRWRAPAIVAAVMLALAIGLSRVALAVHWPTDVAAGWLTGLGWVLLWRPLLSGGPVDRR